MFLIPRFNSLSLYLSISFSLPRSLSLFFKTNQFCHISLSPINSFSLSKFFLFSQGYLSKFLFLLYKSGLHSQRRIKRTTSTSRSPTTPPPRSPLTVPRSLSLCNLAVPPSYHTAAQNPATPSHLTHPRLHRPLSAPFTLHPCRQQPSSTPNTIAHYSSSTHLPTSTYTASQLRCLHAEPPTSKHASSAGRVAADAPSAVSLAASLPCVGIIRTVPDRATPLRIRLLPIPTCNRPSPLPPEVCITALGPPLPLPISSRAKASSVPQPCRPHATTVPFPSPNRSASVPPANP